MADPLVQFSEWLAAAKADPAITEPTAMTLATATPAGIPSARIVLLKEHGPEGFLFYTNLTSRKSQEVKANPHAALCFYWMKLGRQVRVEGVIAPGGDEDADRYFASRPRARQIGAWASLQSQPLASREELEARVADIGKEYEGREVPRPPHWSGWCLKPQTIEFWQASDARLHERELYVLTGNGWEKRLLFP